MNDIIDKILPQLDALNSSLRNAYEDGRRSAFRQVGMYIATLQAQLGVEPEKFCALCGTEITAATPREEVTGDTHTRCAQDQ